METTVFLSQLLGPMIVVAGLSAALYVDDAIKTVSEFLKSYALRYMAGALEMIAGIAIVLSHNYWSHFAEFIISAMGWAMILEGTLWMLAPNFVGGIAKKMRTRNVMMVTGLVSMVIGIYLTYFGYFAG